MNFIDQASGMLKSIDRSNPPKFREDLFNIARTTLSSKVLSQDKEYFSNLAVDAVLRLKVDSTLLKSLIFTQ
jgi:chaperonin GroEL (HSP60 family)